MAHVTPSSIEDRPLVTHIYTADPSAHSFNEKIYIYPSHDRETDIADNDNGDQYGTPFPSPSPFRRRLF